MNVLQWNEKVACIKPPTVEFIISYSLFKIKTGLYTVIQNETFVSLLTANAKVHYGNGARTCVRAASKVVVALSWFKNLLEQQKFQSSRRWWNIKWDGVEVSIHLFSDQQRSCTVDYNVKSEQSWEEEAYTQFVISCRDLD